MRIANLVLPLALATALSACGGDDKPPVATPSESAGSAEPAASEIATATASAEAAPTASAAPTPSPSPAATVAAAPTPVATATPTPAATLAAGNRCRDVETTDWTARLSGGTLTVNGRAHLRTGGWNLSLADRGTAGDGGRKRLIELIAQRPAQGAGLAAGIRPVAFTKANAGTVDRVEVRCGPNRILLIRL